ncbi:MAG: O-acetyl-ADP-ribose deacetylase [Candidatus Margulisiibacteriota bacterium]
MEIKINSTTLQIARGDITKETVDAIVNAANSALAGGGGVDGAIHRAGGPEIMAECRQYDGCPTGQAVITTGGNLPAKYVIHTVGPRYRGTEQDPILLSDCYRNSLQLAVENGIKSISFPSISTGIYGYPIKLAAPIAVTTVKDFLKNNSQIELVRFILFSKNDYDVYNELFLKM